MVTGDREGSLPRKTLIIYLILAVYDRVWVSADETLRVGECWGGIVTVYL